MDWKVLMAAAPRRTCACARATDHFVVSSRISLGTFSGSSSQAAETIFHAGEIEEMVERELAPRHAPNIRCQLWR